MDISSYFEVQKQKYKNTYEMTMMNEYMLQDRLLFIILYALCLHKSCMILKLKIVSRMFAKSYRDI